MGIHRPIPESPALKKKSTFRKWLDLFRSSAFPSGLHHFEFHLFGRSIETLSQKKPRFPLVEELTSGSDPQHSSPPALERFL